jgi:hypothetical protein
MKRIVGEGDPGDRIAGSKVVGKIKIMPGGSKDWITDGA